jgi:hypothetical protein
VSLASGRVQRDLPPRGSAAHTYCWRYGPTPGSAVPVTPVWSGTGPHPRSRYRQDPVSFAELAGADRSVFDEVTWRQGSRGPIRSVFAALRVRPAGVTPQHLAIAADKATGRR